MSRTNYKKVISLFCKAALPLAVLSCRSNNNETEELIPIRTETVQSHSGMLRGEYRFISKPFHTSDLSFRVSGPVDRFEAYPGSRFRKGEVIAALDSRDFELRRERAEALYRQLKAEYERIEILFNKNNVSASAHEKARADYLSAKAAYEEALNALEDTHLRAPFDGYVSEVFIEEFQDVRASQPVVSLIDISKLKIELFVPQEIALAARGTDRTRVVFDAMPDREVEARIVNISKGTSRNNLSYIITALLPNNDGALLSGMSGKAVVVAGDGGKESTGVRISPHALCHRPERGDFVWVVNPEKSTVESRNVSGADLLPDGSISLTGGLSAGEIVATTGLRFLSDGMTVNILR